MKIGNVEVKNDVLFNLRIPRTMLDALKEAVKDEDIPELSDLIRTLASDWLKKRGYVWAWDEQAGEFKMRWPSGTVRRGKR